MDASCGWGRCRQILIRREAEGFREATFRLLCCLLPLDQARRRVGKRLVQVDVRVVHRLSVDFSYSPVEEGIARLLEH